MKIKATFCKFTPLFISYLLNYGLHGQEKVKNCIMICFKSFFFQVNNDEDSHIFCEITSWSNHTSPNNIFSSMIPLSLTVKWCKMPKTKTRHFGVHRHFGGHTLYLSITECIHGKIRKKTSLLKICTIVVLIRSTI